MEGKYAQSIASHLEKFKGAAGHLKVFRDALKHFGTWETLTSVAAVAAVVSAQRRRAVASWRPLRRPGCQVASEESESRTEAQTVRGEDPPMDRRCPALWLCHTVGETSKPRVGSDIWLG